MFTLFSKNLLLINIICHFQANLHDQLVLQSISDFYLLVQEIKKQLEEEKSGRAET